MSSDRIRSLRVLEKLRLAEVDKARIQVAQSLQVKKNIQLEIAKKEKDITENASFVYDNPAGEASSGIQALEASYREWLPKAKDILEKLQDDLKVAKENTEVRRSELIRVNASHEAVKSLIESELQEIKIDQERKQQAEIDDISRTQFLKKRRNIV